MKTKNIILSIFIVVFNFNTYCQTNVDSARYYYNQAIIKNSNKNYNDAINDCIKSRKFDCNAWNSEPAYLAGMIYFNSGDFKNALIYFTSASSMYNGRVMRGRCEYELGNYLESYYQLNLAIYEDNKNPSAFFYRGLVSIKINDSDLSDLTYVASFKNQYTDQAKRLLSDKLQ
jgi:tetratricopeptide (TPR) repeat protein